MASEVDDLRMKIEAALKGSDPDICEVLMDEALDLEDADELDDLLVELEMHVGLPPGLMTVPAFPPRIARVRLLNLHVLIFSPASACKICVSSSPRWIPRAKSAFPLHLSRFRLLNLHVLLASLESAC